MFQIEVWEDPEDNRVSHLARQLRLILFPMYKREYELNQILDQLKNWKFDEDDKPYQNMIFDLIMPEKVLITKCLPILERQALQLENLRNFAKPSE